MDTATQTKMTDLPESWAVDHIDTGPGNGLNVRAATQAALRAPLASLELADLAGPGTRICIALGDPGKHGAAQLEALAVLIETLRSAGVRPADIMLLASAAFLQWGGLDLPEDITVSIHDPADLRAFSALGSVDGVALEVNQHASGADLLIGIALLGTDDVWMTGSAGAVTHGLASAALRRDLDDGRFLDARVDPRGQAGLRRILREGARRAGLVFAIDMLIDSAGRVLALQAGAPQPVENALRMLAHTLRESDVGATYDVVVTDSRPRDLYQASLSAIALGLTPESALVRNGVMLMPVLPDAPDASDPDNTDANAFYAALSDSSTPTGVMALLRQRSLSRGEARAYLFAHVLENYPVIAVGMAEGAQPRHVIAARDMADAADLAESLSTHHGRRKLRALIVNNGQWTVPIATRDMRSDDDVVGELLRDLDLD